MSADGARLGRYRLIERIAAGGMGEVYLANMTVGPGLEKTVVVKTILENFIEDEDHGRLPDWLAPSGHFSLRCRQQACERIAAGDTAEQAAPHCKDPSRSPDATTVRRWAQRRLLSLWCWAAIKGQHFLQAPTILAWDLAALCRILPFEARSP